MRVMRLRTDNPHDLPPRLYERWSKRKITWWTKNGDGKTHVLRSVARDSQPETIEAARATAIALHSVFHGRQPRAEAATIEAWMKNAGIAEKGAVRMVDCLPAWAHRLYVDSKRRAGTRRVLWTLTRSEFAAVVARSDGFCEVSGLPLSLTIGKQKGPYGPSIDRINSSAGYTPRNVRIVCAAVNCALNSWGLEAFLPVARAIAKLHPDSKGQDFGICGSSKKSNGLQPFDRNPLN